SQFQANPPANGTLPNQREKLRLHRALTALPEFLRISAFQVGQNVSIRISLGEPLPQLVGPLLCPMAQFHNHVFETKYGVQKQSVGMNHSSGVDSLLVLRENSVIQFNMLASELLPRELLRPAQTFNSE